MGARDVEHAAEEGGGAAHLEVGIEAFEIEDDGGAMDTHALAGGLERGFGVFGGVDDEVAVGFGEADEIAFRVDDGLLDEVACLFEQAAEQVRLSGAGIALDEQSCGEEFGEVHYGRSAADDLSHFDVAAHGGGDSLPTPCEATGKRGFQIWACKRMAKTETGPRSRL
ncbi:hypothetical protein AOE01nite_12730 [Acetobacter oeni]|uniref:Uncharacterized protein n=1 Tax=Acetobacter oeni TaxID=304077 RepID=A0A511XJC8_9PROT|nr:hypothetical protein AOE01nite_12730 [Acetobacter oeni]